MIINQDTCLKNRISECDQRTYLVTRGASRSVRSSSWVDQGFIGYESSDGCDFSQSRRSGSTVWIAIGPSTLLMLHRTVQTFRGRTPRSRSDRTTIAARSTHNRRTIGPRSGHDRVPIVGLFEPKFKPIHRGIEAKTSPQGTAPTKP